MKAGSGDFGGSGDFRLLLFECVPVMVSYGEYFEEREVVSDDLGGDRVG